MTYTRSKDYTNIVVREQDIQTFKVMVVVLLSMFHVCVPTITHPLLLICGHVICPNIRQLKIEQVGI